MPAQVRCKWCGLLAVRSAVDAQIFPASERTRETAELRTHEFPGEEFPGISTSIVRRPDKLVCYVGQQQFAAGVDMAGAQSTIDCTRECEEFIEWIPGRTPEQHLAMRELQSQREYNERQLEADRLWRERQDTTAHNRHKESLAVAQWGTIIAFCGTILVVLTNLLMNWMGRQPPVPPAAAPTIIVNTGEPSVPAPASSK